MIFDYVSESIARCLREGEDSQIEFLQSEIHECDKSKNNSIFFFTSPDGKFKCISNYSNTFCFPISQEVLCCMWCGYKGNIIDVK